MSIERERYEQMMAPASWWQRFRRLFVFPPLPQADPWEHSAPSRMYDGRFVEPGWIEVGRSQPSWLRRNLLCRFDLCDLWYRKDDGAQQGYACAGCDRTSMMQAPTSPPTGGPTERRGSIFPLFDVDTPMPAPRNPPSGGTSATKASYREEPSPDVPFFTRRPLRRVPLIPQAEPAAPPAQNEPIIGYMSETAFRLLRDTEGWWGPVYRDRAELTRGGVVEVEVRFRRIVEACGNE